MQHELNFPFKARYYKLGEINTNTKQIWWVLHGYGQMSQFFIQKFKILSEQGICVIAPEGLSRFYLEGNSGRVGASWMTRENRETDIENYISYLDAVWKIENNSSEIPTTLFGFSQGAATAVRWAMNGKINFDRLILWAGLFPPDIDFVKGSELLRDKKIIEVLGKQDQFITKDKIEEMLALNQKLKISPTIIEFEGKHEISDEILTRVALS
jgi:predicted esterase